MADSILDRLFPPAPAHKTPERRVHTNHVDNLKGQYPGGNARKEVTTKWAAVYTLELRGFTKAAIAEALNMSVGGVAHIQADDRYIKYREEHLSALDQEFVAMKPLAFAALRGGLDSSDQNTALRASEQWFKAANYGGFSKHERPAISTSAEDIARSLLNQVNIQVNVSVPPKDE